jgi:hypothetical protein
MKLCTFTVLSALFAELAFGADYSLDTEGANHLRDTPVTLAPPSRIAVYMVGPRRGPDSKLWSVVPSGAPDYSTTNHAEVRDLMSILQHSDNKRRIQNESMVQGVTFHLMLFQGTNKTVIQVLVFEPLESNGNLCSINPRGPVNYVYYNGEIGPWLNARVKGAKKALTPGGK